MPDWFKPAGVDLSPRRARPVPSPVPRRLRPAVARWGQSALGALVVAAVLVGGALLAGLPSAVAVGLGVGWLIIVVRIARRRSPTDGPGGSDA